MTDKHAFTPDWASPPGDTLALLLDEQGMTQTELADRLGVSLKHVNRVVKGAASLSADFALGLEKVFRTPASFWLTREAQFQADLARREQLGALESEVGWAEQFPTAELKRRGLVSRDARGATLVNELLSFFGIAGPAQWADPLVAYRKSTKAVSDDLSLATWLREGERIAAGIECRPYDESKFLEVLQEVRELTRREPGGWWPRLQALCATAGVVVVIVDAYPGAKVNGATRWLSPDRALIQLSLRYLWEDIFWFTFFHEAGHVVLHRKKQIFIELQPKAGAPYERHLDLEAEADRFAARTLIPTTYEPRLRRLTISEAPAFARKIGVAPAIVIGRLQHDNIIKYSQGNQHRRRLPKTVAELI